MAPKQTRMTLNIGGTIYETYKSTLNKYPDTLLGRLGPKSPQYDELTDCYFFDRSGNSFEAILWFFQSKNALLACPAGTSITLFEEECLFYELPKPIIRDMMLKEGILPEFLDPNHYKNMDSYNDGKEEKITIRQHIWNFLDDPDTSKPAFLFALLTLAAILAVVVCSSLETISYVVDVHGENLAMIEKVLNYWFLVELILRVLTCPSLKDFLLEVMNWVDAVAILPYFFMLAISPDSSSVAFLRACRLIRIVRIFRLSKQWKRLRAMILIIVSCAPDIQLFLGCFLLLMIFGGSVVYFAEEGQLTEGFESVPHSVWWAAASITTVGYGDAVPSTPMGQVFALVFIIFGIVTISLPVLQINARFQELYETNFIDKARPKS